MKTVGEVIKDKNISSILVDFKDADGNITDTCSLNDCEFDAQDLNLEVELINQFYSCDSKETWLIKIYKIKNENIYLSI